MPQDNAEAPGVPTATWVIDGLEGRLARVEVEAGHAVEMSLASLPRGVMEGDVLRMYEAGGDFTLEIDYAETAWRQA